MSIRPTAMLRDAAQPLHHFAQRIEAELEFARMLIDLQPKHAEALTSAITAAETLAKKVFASADPAAIRTGVAAIESALAPAGAIAKTYTIYAIGHAHIDMNWMWGWPETVAVCNDTFATVLKLMDEFPSFVFSQSQASVYRIIEEYNPALLQQIKARVKDGRWEVTASHWVEGDRNMVSGESLTRHLLYTRKYMQQLFGLTPEDVPIDWSPDTFGHPLSVPMYLTRGGVRYVYLHRPGEIGPKRPMAFWWKSPDGSRVLVRNDADNGYNGTFAPDIIKSLNRFCGQTGLTFTNFVYGVGDHGGGPTRQNIATAIEMNQWPIFPTIKFSTAKEFYQRLEKEGGNLPTLDCELNTELTGCYTTQSLIKRCNRIAEHRLLDAEAACVLASAATGRPYPAQELEQAWRDTLFSHFHDILPGSNVRDSRSWTHGLFQKTMATTSIAETLALRELAASINTSVPGIAPATPAASGTLGVLGAGAGFGSDRDMISLADNTGGGPRAIIIFNPTSVKREEIVEATLWIDSPSAQITDEMRARPISIRTPEGTLIPAQKIEFGQYWGHAFVRIAFPVSVPSLGYATYTVLDEEAPPVELMAQQITRPYHCSYVVPDRRPEGLKNGLICLEIEPITGGIKSLEHWQSGIILMGTMPWGLEYSLEKPHGMSAWIIDHATQYARPEVLSIDRKLDGPYKASIDVKLKIKNSEFVLTYEIRAGDPRLYLHLRGIWMERGTPQTGVPSLRFAMDLGMIEEMDMRYEIPFSTIGRELTNGEEVPSLNFAMASGLTDCEFAGILLLNDCKHGHSLDDHTLRLTLIRSSYEPDPLPDAGQHEIHLAIMPFDEPMTPATAITEGKSFNRPLRIITTHLHDGDLPAVASALEVSPEGILLSDIKQADDGEGIIINLVNTTDGLLRAKVKLNALLGVFGKAVGVDLMERPTADNPAKLVGKTLSIPVQGNTVSSVKLGRKRK